MNDASNFLNLPFPNFIKMDVDGLEHIILEGGEDILKTITKSNTKSPLPVKDRRVGARMKKYRQVRP